MCFIVEAFSGDNQINKLIFHHKTKMFLTYKFIFIEKGKSVERTVYCSYCWK